MFISAIILHLTDTEAFVTELQLLSHSVTQSPIVPVLIDKTEISAEGLNEFIGSIQKFYYLHGHDNRVIIRTLHWPVTFITLGHILSIEKAGSNQETIKQ